MNPAIIFMLILVLVALSLTMNRGALDEHIKPSITSSEGELWVMIALDEKRFRDGEDIALVENLIEHPERNELAELDGESSGAGAMDVSFYTPSVKKAAIEAADFLNRNYPNLRYFISDEYEVLFEKHD